MRYFRDDYLKADCATMIGVDEWAEALTLIAGLAARSNISELIMRPMTLRAATEMADIPYGFLLAS